VTDLENLARIDGFGLSFRLIQPDDAGFIFGLRTDSSFNRHLSKVQGTVEDQRLWIDRYKDREAAGLELYYIIERLGSDRCGAVRLYNMTGTDFEWGSWILNHDKPPKAALESATLIYHIAFDLLHLKATNFEVRRDNSNTLAFHRRYGAVETRSDAENIYFTYAASQFSADKGGYWALLKAAAQRG